MVNVWVEQWKLKHLGSVVVKGSSWQCGWIWWYRK